MTATFDPQIRMGSKPAPQANPGPVSESVIDKHSHFNGHYHTAYDLRIEGSVEGDIECDGTVTVAQEARAATKIRARNVIVAGSADGEITCLERFTLQPTGQMRGQVQAASLVVEEGAFFEGQFKMADGQEVKPDNKPLKIEDRRPKKNEPPMKVETLDAPPAVVDSNEAKIGA